MHDPKFNEVAFSRLSKQHLRIEAREDAPRSRSLRQEIAKLTEDKAEMRCGSQFQP